MESELPSYSGVNLSWIAGLFDGEGYIVIHRQTNSNAYRMVAGIDMCHKPTLEIFHSVFGGSLNWKEACRGTNTLSKKSLWSWKTGKKSDALLFLKTIQPLSITKRLEIDVGIEFCEFIQGRQHYKRWTVEEMAIAFAFVQKLKSVRNFEYKKDDGSIPSSP